MFDYVGHKLPSTADANKLLPRMYLCGVKLSQLKCTEINFISRRFIFTHIAFDIIPRWQRTKKFKKVYIYMHSLAITFVARSLLLHRLAVLVAGNVILVTMTLSFKTNESQNNIIFSYLSVRWSLIFLNLSVRWSFNNFFY